MKFDNFGNFLVILGDFSDKTCTFGVENNFIPLFFWKNKQTAKITFLILIKENMMKIVCQCAVTEPVIS